MQMTLGGRLILKLEVANAQGNCETLNVDIWEVTTIGT